MKHRVIVACGVVLAAAQPALAAALLPGSSGKEPYTVDASKLDYFEKEQKLVYTGDVIATQGQTKVRGSVMTIYLDKSGAGGQQDVRRVELKGPVTVVQKDKVGTGNSGVYDKPENKWYLIGNVTLTQGATVTQGDKLIYDLGTGRATVTGGARTVLTPRDSTRDAARDTKEKQ
ncbi:MAG: organic solvent tolerance protein OstA [Hyphomicrobiales bacterium]|nr:organic solvent tolerance protein OstA [Hyphomicrobiales bacterium]